MMRRRLFRVVFTATTLCNFVISFSISQTFRLSERIRLASSNNDDYEEISSSSQIRRPGRIRPKRSAAVTAEADARKAQAQERHEEALKDPSLLSNEVFAERTDLHPATKRALTETMGLKFMTEIQLKTYAAAWSGQSVLASARTGTGKTLAFLTPAVERILQGDRSLYVPGRNIGILVLAPTRELAIQIADEARLLLTFHSKDLSVMDMYGGTKMARDLTVLNKRLPTILVATPGKLLDHITSSRVGGRRFRDIISQTKIVVLDETDRLLDMGFQRDVTKILSNLPRSEKRQTLMFSATIPKRMQSVMKEVLPPDYVEVQVANNEQDSGDTNTRVKQTYLVLESMDDYVVKLLEIVRKAMQSTDDFKILVFFPATKLVRFFANVFNDIGLEVPIKELHSRMTQSARQRASSDFRTSMRAVLFTSDVSARGVDYPGITHVIQYGSADSKVTYTHRVGRTGRAGRTGEGILVLLPFERKLVNGLRRNGVEENHELAIGSTDEEARLMLEPIRNRIQSGNTKMVNSVEGVCRAFLAYYMSRADGLGLTPEAIVASANEFAASIGLSELPSLSEKTAKKLNLIGLKGVSIDSGVD